MVVYEIWDLIPAYTKKWLVSWFDDKELLLGADVIYWNSLLKKKYLFFICFRYYDKNFPKKKKKILWQTVDFVENGFV